MEVLHVTPTSNVKSIIKSKIFRSKPILPIYNQIMSDYYDDEYDKDRGLVFGFPESIYNRDKIIKDFIYWKVWGSPRNIFLHKLSDEDYEKYKEFGYNLFKNFKIVEGHFSILLLNLDYEPIFDYYLHRQSYDMSEYWSDMDVRYEHNDKPLSLINYDVDKTKIKRILGTAELSISKNNKLNISLKI
jgi:hypothetical protein